MAIWDESKHPRNEKGQFTYSEGGVLKGGIEKTENNEGLLGKLLGGYSLGEIKDILFSVISTAAPSIIKTGLTIAQMKNFIKENNLEKELIKKIENIKTNKGMAEIKRKSQGDKNNSSNLISLGNSSNNLTNNRIKSKIKETPKDILYGSSNINNQLKLKQDDYKSKLLDILGNHATQGDVLYGKPESLEKKVRELGLENELNQDKNKYLENDNKNIEKNIAINDKKIDNIGLGITSKTNTDSKNLKTDIKEAKLINNSNLETEKRIKPVNYTKISSPYGWRYHPIKKRNIFHQGIDLAANASTPVKAPIDGTVISAKWEGAYGNCVRIKHTLDNGKEITTVYAHLNSFTRANGTILKAGQKVKQGEQIGRVGSTGKDKNGKPTSTGNHLHFEVRYNNEPQNPHDYFNDLK